MRLRRDLFTASADEVSLRVERRRLSRTTLPLVYCALAVLICGCPAREERRTFDCLPPLANVVFEAYTAPLLVGHWDVELWTRPVPGIDTGTLVEMRVFGGFVPGMTAEAAAAKYGPPKRRRTDAYGTWYEYPTDLGRVEIVCEKSRSGGDDSESEACDWRLYAYPQRGVQALFHPEVARQVEAAKAIRPSAKWALLHVLNAAGSQEVECRYEDWTLQRLRLLRTSRPLQTSER